MMGWPWKPHPPASYQTFLYNIENSHITYLTQTHKIINYFQYADDTLIFNSNYTDIHAILTDINAITPIYTSQQKWNEITQ